MRIRDTAASFGRVVLVALAGQVIENPENGERVRFLRTARQTRGELLRFESVLQPGGFVGAEHIHPQQSSHFRVVKGTVAFRVAGRVMALAPDQTLTVLSGTPHRYWNESAEEICLIVEFRPALRTEILFETFFGLARDGKVAGEQVRNILQEAVLLDEFRRESRPVKLRFPARLVPVLAALGRRLGYQAVYDRYSGIPTSPVPELPAESVG